MKQLLCLIVMVLTAATTFAQPFEWHQVQRPGGWPFPFKSKFDQEFTTDSAKKVFTEDFHWSTTDHGRTWTYTPNHVFAGYNMSKYFAAKLFWGQYLVADTGGIYKFDRASQQKVIVFRDSTFIPSWQFPPNFYQAPQGSIYCILGQPNKLYISNDTGSTWQYIGGLLPGKQVQSILSISRSGKIFLTADANVYISDDGGRSWDSVYTSATRGLIGSMAESYDGRWYASAHTGGMGNNDPYYWWLLGCDSSGRSWRTVSSLAAYTVETSPLDPYATVAFTLTATKNNGLFAAREERYNTDTLLQSTDGGETWHGIPHPPGLTLLSVPFEDNDGFLYEVGYRGGQQAYPSDVGICISSDQGAHWESGGIPHLQVSQIFVDSDTKDVLLRIGTPRLYWIAEYGSTSTKLTDSLRTTEHFFTPGKYWTDTVLRTIAVDRHNNYLGFSNGGTLLRSTDKGRSWQETFGPGQNILVEKIVVDRNGIIWIPTAGDYVYRSTDNGISWDQILNGITNPNIFSIAESPTGFIFAGGPSSIYRTKETYFTKLKPNLINTNVTCFAFDSVGGIYAGTDMRGVIYSNDNGETWKALRTGLPPDTAVSALMVSRQGVVMAATYDGLYTLTVGDTLWHENGAGINDRMLLSLGMLDDETYLVGTFVSGLYVNKPFPAPPLLLGVTLAPSVRVEGSSQLGTNYPNPFGEETKIRYEVTEAGKVILEVYSILGERIATLENGYHSPGTYESSFSATDIPSGTYLYRLRIGEHEQIRRMIKH